MKAKKITVQRKKVKNPWLVHLMEERKKNQDKSFKQVMLIAKKSYKPIKK